MKSRESNVDDGQNKALSKRSRWGSKSCSSERRPLLGKCFYLDLASSKKAEALEKDIRVLGGTIEKFFSKDIKYLVSDKREAKYVWCLGRNSPVASPDSGHSSPHPRRESPRSSSQGLTDAVITSRGKSLVEKVIKDQERLQINRILSNALEWGVKVLYIEDMVSYVEKKKRDLSIQSKAVSAIKKEAESGSTQRAAFQERDAGRINRPFVKVEDSTRQYRPIFHSMPCLPELNFTAAPPRTPFQVDNYGKASHGRKMKDRSRPKEQRAEQSQEGDGVRPHKVREKKHCGYCECCLVKFETLKAHLSTEQHKAFSKTDAYSAVDRLILGMTFDVAKISPITRAKCSVSSVVQVSGPRLTPGNRKEVGVTRPPGAGEGSSWDRTAPCRPRKRSRESPSGGCDPVIELSCRNEGAPPLTPVVALQPVESSSLGKTIASASGQPPGTSGMVTGLKEEMVNRKTESDSCFSQNAVDSLQWSPEVASGDAGTTRTLQDSVQMANMKCEAVSVYTTSSEPSQVQCSNWKLQRKVRNARKYGKATRTSEGPVKNTGSLNSVLWQLFRSSEDMGCEFTGFEDQ